MVCSTAVESVAYTVNALGSRVNLTRHRENDDEEDDELRFNTAVVTSADLMATDGVVHVIDQVVVPNNGLSSRLSSSTMAVPGDIYHFGTPPPLPLSSFLRSKGLRKLEAGTLKPS